MKYRSKTVKVAVLFICLMLALVSLSSCGMVYDLEEVHDVAEEFIDAVIEDDRKEAYELTKNIYTEKEFRAIYSQYRKILDGVDEYELKAVETYTEVDNGTKYSDVLYEMVAGDESFVVDVTVSSTSDGLSYIYINTYDAAVEEGYIVVSTTGVINIIFGLIVVAQLIFLVIVIVDCARHKMKRKALWIVIVILGGVTVILMREAGGLYARLNFLEILGTYIHTYSDNSFEMALTIPVGAIVYLGMRKKLLRAWKEENALKEAQMAEAAAAQNAQAEAQKDETETLEDTVAEAQNEVTESLADNNAEVKPVATEELPEEKNNDEESL